MGGEGAFGSLMGANTETGEIYPMSHSYRNPPPLTFGQLSPLIYSGSEVVFYAGSDGVYCDLK